MLKMSTLTVIVISRRWESFIVLANTANFLRRDPLVALDLCNNQGSGRAKAYCEA